MIEPPTPDQGARRVWSDSRGRLWISEWNAGQVSVYDSHDGGWNAWRLPGDLPRTSAVYVDERDIVWLSDFGGNAVHAFDPQTDKFTTYPNNGLKGPSRISAERVTGLSVDRSCGLVNGRSRAIS